MGQLLYSPSLHIERILRLTNVHDSVLDHEHFLYQHCICVKNLYISHLNCSGGSTLESLEGCSARTTPVFQELWWATKYWSSEWSASWSVPWMPWMWTGSTGAWLSLDEQTGPGTDRFLPQRTLVTQVQTAALSHQRCHQQMSLRDPEDVALPALSTCWRKAFQSVRGCGVRHGQSTQLSNGFQFLDPLVSDFCVADLSSKTKKRQRHMLCWFSFPPVHFGSFFL